MRRLLFGLVAGGFLAFIGAQAFHRHAEKSPEPCGVCALGGQSARHLPLSSPQISASGSWEQDVLEPRSQPSAARRGETSARGPPIA